jgi:hypothetical protein
VPQYTLEADGKPKVWERNLTIGRSPRAEYGCPSFYEDQAAIDAAMARPTRAQLLAAVVGLSV